MKSSKWIILIQLFIMAMLLGLLAAELNKTGSTANKRDDVLIHYDQNDLNRMIEMIRRFREGNGDNLLLIEPTMDNRGRFIHEFYSDGKVLHWTEEYTRDEWNAPPRPETVCKAIDLKEYRDRFDVELSQCNIQPSSAIFIIVSFLKENE